MIYVLSLALLILSGCYSFRGGSVPSHLNTIAIPLFDDQSGSAEPTLREKLTNKLLDRFRQDNSLQISDRTHADSIIEGTVTSMRDEAAVVEQGETVKQSRLTIGVKVSFQDTKLKKKVWEKDFSNWGLYEISGGATQRQAALDVAIDKVTEDILNEAVSGW